MLNPSSQYTVTREMCQQEIHLIGQNLPSLQVDVFRMGRAEGDCKQLHAGLFGGPARFVIVAAFTGGDDISPIILSTLAQRLDVIPRKQEIGKLPTTVKTQALVAAEQGLIA